MAGSAFGLLFTVTNFGESHGPAIGCVIDGCPPGMSLSEADIQPELDRRRPGTSRHVTQRNEADVVEVEDLVYSKKTTGTPIALLIRNTDQRSKDYGNIAQTFRPGHADYTYWHKYGIRDPRGGGRSSARLTAPMVAAGAVAKKILREQFGVEVLAYVKQVQKIIGDVNPETVKLKDVEANIVRCPDAKAAEKMIRLIEKMRREGNTVGGIVEGVARGVPAGGGEPVFDKLEADLAKVMLSLPACKGFESGDGFAGILLTGLEHNDAFRAKGGNVFTKTNRSGGIQGGISNGETIFFRTAFKPVATVMHVPDTVDEALHNTTLKGRGRHDPCVLPRAVQMVEAMTALVLADHALRQRAQCG
jgi:chorismate synthase